MVLWGGVERGLRAAERVWQREQEDDGERGGADELTGALRGGGFEGEAEAVPAGGDGKHDEAVGGRGLKRVRATVEAGGPAGEVELRDAEAHAGRALDC